MEEVTATSTTQATPFLIKRTYKKSAETFPLPASIAMNDELIQESLGWAIPYINIAKLERSEPKDGVVAITKSAGCRKEHPYTKCHFSRR